jgi:hypothetical protein
VAEHAWETFNIGTGELAQAYRARKLRSLNKGDVLAIDGTFYSCESTSWHERSCGELYIVWDGQSWLENLPADSEEARRIQTIWEA